MEAKDTVIDYADDILTRRPFRELLKEQAETSFKAGQGQTRRVDREKIAAIIHDFQYPDEAGIDPVYQSGIHDDYLDCADHILALNKPDPNQVEKVAKWLYYFVGNPPETWDETIVKDKFRDYATQLLQEIGLEEGK